MSLRKGTVVTRDYAFPSAMLRFISKVNIVSLEPGHCWNYLGSIAATGYGYFDIRHG